ncbi:MAG: cyclic nucleotide-binding domain-containing protein [Endomicrobium sp.]|jgi:CRP/FNR family transcriptional regulator|nr:cyclic nucleotide-binding domain-containing protein [Endomicrobium sp.]
MIKKHTIGKLINFLFLDDVLKDDIIFLKKIILFHGLPKRALAKIALIIFKKTYFPGEKIYKINQEANVFYIIRNGQIKLTENNLNKVIETENFFGEISLIENRNHTNEALALKESELYLIYRAKFENMVSSNIKIGFKVMKNLASLFATKNSSVL